jgi:hypothetical protein
MQCATDQYFDSFSSTKLGAKIYVNYKKQDGYRHPSSTLILLASAVLNADKFEVYGQMF